MSKYRDRLPQLDGGRFLTDGGLETTLVFHDGMDLPCFAAFDLLKSREGYDRLRDYYRRYTSIARDAGAGFVLESPTWRANRDWGSKLGYDAAALAEANRIAVDLMEDLREECETLRCPYVISGNIGPRGDGYKAEGCMTAAAAADYHRAQIETFRDTSADLVSAVTLNYVDEAVGIVDAARQAGMPVVISFTVETDGRLPTGETLADAIAQTDARTSDYAAYFMVNCAHPTHFRDVLDGGEWLQRIRGVRANASRRSHAELDESPDLDDGDPDEFGREHRELQQLLPRLTVIGGCCGTDHRHVREISRRCYAEPLAAAGHG